MWRLNDAGLCLPLLGSRLLLELRALLRYGLVVDLMEHRGYAVRTNRCLRIAQEIVHRLGELPHALFQVEAGCPCSGSFFKNPDLTWAAPLWRDLLL